MQRWREQYLGLAEFPPAMASAEVDQFFTLNRDELAAVRTRRGPLNPQPAERRVADRLLADDGPHSELIPDSSRSRSRASRGATSPDAAAPGVDPRFVPSAADIV